MLSVGTNASTAARVLVTDDDPQVRNLFATTLTDAGYVVTQAESGRKALDALRRDRYDVIVLDLNMPGVDGFDVLRAVRFEFPRVKALTISGYMDGAFLQASRCLGADLTLGKPSSPKSLVAAVRRLA